MAALSSLLIGREITLRNRLRPSPELEQSFTYELPFGRGHNLAELGIAAYTLGGLEDLGNRLRAFGSAISLSPRTARTSTRLESEQDWRPDRVLYRVSHAVGSANHWFDPTAFSTPRDVQRRRLHSAERWRGLLGKEPVPGTRLHPGQYLHLQSFPIFREASGEFRFDAFQLSNTPQFANPTSNNCCATTNAASAPVTSTLAQRTRQCERRRRWPQPAAHPRESTF